MALNIKASLLKEVSILFLLSFTRMEDRLTKFATQDLAAL